MAPTIFAGMINIKLVSVVLDCADSIPALVQLGYELFD